MGAQKSIMEDSNVRQSVAPEPAPSPRRKLPSWVKMGAVLAALGTAVALLMTGGGASNAFVYSKLVDEVVQHPERFAGRELRVEGLLEQGSVRFREQPCQWRFVIAKSEVRMPVIFNQCTVPDTFRDDMGISVTVQGRYGDGRFLASQVIAKCPSKYEMQQRKSKGEAMPHALPALAK